MYYLMYCMFVLLVLPVPQWGSWLWGQTWEVTRPQRTAWTACTTCQMVRMSDSLPLHPVACTPPSRLCMHSVFFTPRMCSCACLCTAPLCCAVRPTRSDWWLWEVWWQPQPLRPQPPIPTFQHAAAHPAGIMRVGDTRVTGDGICYLTGDTIRMVCALLRDSHAACHGWLHDWLPPHGCFCAFLTDRWAAGLKLDGLQSATSATQPAG